LASTLDSLATAAGCTAEQVRATLLAFEEPEDWGAISIREELPRRLEAALARAPGRMHFEECIYFHGTRTADPERFRREGILPFGAYPDRYWDFLHILVAEECGQDEWRDFRVSVEQGSGRSDGWYYRHRLQQDQQGPYGTVVRELLLDPGGIIGDYLARVELVIDLGRAFEARCGIDLDARFRAATEPYVVTFRSSIVTASALEAALWFAYEWLRKGRLTNGSDVAYRGAGIGVPPEDVLAVERMRRDGSRWRFGEAAATHAPAGG
jgi:hypothetical protein